MVFRRAGDIALFSLITQAANIGMYMLLARFISVEEFATLRQLFLIQSIIIAIAISALPSALLYFSGQANIDAVKRLHAHVILWIVLGLTALLTILLSSMSPVMVVLFANVALSEHLPVFSLGIAGFVALSLIPAYLVTIKKTKIAPMLSFFLAVAMNLPVVLLALNGATIHSIVKVIGCVYLVFGSIILTWMLIDSKTIMHKHLLKDVVTSVWRYITPLILAATIAIIGLKVDHIIVSAMLGVTIYAIYTVGAFEIPVFSVIQNAISASLLPEISQKIKQGQVAEAQILWKRTNQKVAWLTFPIALLLIYFAEYVVWGLFGEKYIDAAQVFVIFTTLVFVRVMNFGLLLRATGKTHFELYAHIIFVVVSLSCAYGFTHSFGLIGAAYAVLTSTLTLCLTMMLFSLRVEECKISLLSVYPIKELGLALICLLFMFLFPVRELTLLTS